MLVSAAHSGGVDLPDSCRVTGRAVAAGPRPRPPRDRLRLERGFLAQAAEGVFEPECRRRLRTLSSSVQQRPSDDDLLSTVMSLYRYYTMRADLDSARSDWSSPSEEPHRPTRCSCLSTIPASGCWPGTAANSTMRVTKMDGAAQTLSDEGAQALDACCSCRTMRPRPLTHLALSPVSSTGDLAGAEADSAKPNAAATNWPFPRVPSAWRMHARWRC